MANLRFQPKTSCPGHPCPWQHGWHGCEYFWISQQAPRLDFPFLSLSLSPHISTMCIFIRHLCPVICWFVILELQTNALILSSCSLLSCPPGIWNSALIFLAPLHCLIDTSGWFHLRGLQQTFQAPIGAGAHHLDQGPPTSMPGTDTSCQISE